MMFCLLITFCKTHQDLTCSVFPYENQATYLASGHQSQILNADMNLVHNCSWFSTPYVETLKYFLNRLTSTAHKLQRIQQC